MLPPTLALRTEIGLSRHKIPVKLTRLRRGGRHAAGEFVPRYADAQRCTGFSPKIKRAGVGRLHPTPAPNTRPHRIRGRSGVQLLVDQILDITDDEVETIRFAAECAVTDFSSQQLE